ncbi:MAG: hypothetical protein ACLPWS_11365 [Rhodomicrobium sp.]
MLKHLSLPALAAAIVLAAPVSFVPGLSGAAQAGNVSDGAAKGQASERTITPPKGGRPSMAIKNSGVPKNTSKANPRLNVKGVKQGK